MALPSSFSRNGVKKRGDVYKRQPDTSTLDPLLKSSVPEYSVSLSEEGALVQISVFSSFPMEDPVPLYTLTVRKEEAAP